MWWMIGNNGEDHQHDESKVVPTMAEAQVEGSAQNGKKQVMQSKMRKGWRVIQWQLQMPEGIRSIHVARTGVGKAKAKEDSKIQGSTTPERTNRSKTSYLKRPTIWGDNLLQGLGWNFFCSGTNYYYTSCMGCLLI